MSRQYFLVVTACLLLLWLPAPRGVSGGEGVRGGESSPAGGSGGEGVRGSDTQLVAPLGVTIHESCGVGEERTRLIWSARYMRAASRSRAFVHCLYLGVNRLQPLKSAQESIWVGPYFTCKGPPGSDHRDPEFVLANRTLAFEATAALAQARSTDCWCSAVAPRTATPPRR